MIDTFTGWIDGFTTRTEKAEEVVKKKKQKILHEIIPRFGLRRSLQGDNGTSFTSKVTQGSLKYCTLLIISIVPGGLSLQEKQKEPTNF